MKFLKRLSIILFALSIICVTGQKLQAQQINEERKVSTFENVVIEASINTYVYVSYDKVPGVTVKADQRVMEKIKTSVSGETLTIHFNSKHFEEVKVEIYVRMPMVKKVSILGGGQVEVKDGFNADLLQADIQGGGNIRFSEQAEVSSFQSKVTGGGSIDALKLKITNATVNVSGGGEVLLNVMDRLEGNIAGGGNIFYEGNPDVSSKVIGGGRVAMIND